MLTRGLNQVGPSLPPLSIIFWLSCSLFGDVVCEALASSADSQGTQPREEKAAGFWLVSRSTDKPWEPRAREGEMRLPGYVTRLAQSHPQGQSMKNWIPFEVGVEQVQNLQKPPVSQMHTGLEQRDV